jgi:hypothetical protein
MPWWQGPTYHGYAYYFLELNWHCFLQVRYTLDRSEILWSVCLPIFKSVMVVSLNVLWLPDDGKRTLLVSEFFRDCYASQVFEWRWDRLNKWHAQTRREMCTKLCWANLKVGTRELNWETYAWMGQWYWSSLWNNVWGEDRRVFIIKLVCLLN